MKVVTAEEMRGIDRRTIEEFGIPGSVLMERAGVAAASRIRGLFEKRKTIVLCGGGNNGGDGIVVARELHNSGWNAKVLLLVPEDRLSPECLHQFGIAKEMGVSLQFRTKLTPADMHSAMVVDAVFGTGLARDVDGETASLISFLNASAAPVVSIDIPSGISSDTGQVLGTAVRADYTVTFGLPKRGHLLHPGAEYAGKLFIEDIGFPESLLTSPDLPVEAPEKKWIASLVPERPTYSHKGDYGHVLVIAGSRGKTGAALMASRACLRTGAGLVTIGIPESLMDVYQSRVTEEMTLPLPDTGEGTLSAAAADTILAFTAERADVLCIGPGIGVSDETRRLIASIVGSSRAPVVIDADGLNSLALSGTKAGGAGEILKKAAAPLILTPHPGEMARLLKNSRSRDQIEKDRLGTALSFSEETGVCLVLKGVPTIIADPDGKAYLNPTGNPGMATAGSGDVLTGMISALLAQHLSPDRAAILGVYLHGLAGDIAASEKGPHSLVASDIIDALPAAFRDMKLGTPDLS